MTTNGRKQLGMTLVEVIVAAAIALVGFLVALTLYQAARQSFRKGEQAADQQQEVRVAYDRMMKDLRLAGYNWNATGEDRPGEEQIEGAWSGAITVRADYDFEDATLSQDPENLIAGSTAKATVGNDEIVTFMLAKDVNNDGTPDATGDATLAFNADVNSSTTASSTLYGTVATRDGSTETVTIPYAYLTQNDPPYNLYRVALNNTSTTFGAAAFRQYQLLATNVKSLTFTYLDAAGATITPPLGTESAAAKTDRANIKKINVTIVGMTGQPDPGYTDPTDSNPLSQHYRKFSLTSQVTPRNIGFKGRADSDLTPPSIPTGLSLCAGHCGALLVTWNPNPSSEAVTQYDLKYGTSSTSLSNVLSSSGTSLYVQGLTAGTTYYFALRASDASSNHSAYTTTISGVVNDGSPATSPVTVPSAPTGFTGTGHGGTGGLNGRVDLSWSAVATNSVALVCDPTSPAIRDFGGYRLYRSESTPFTPGSGNIYVEEPGGPDPLVTKFPSATSTTWTDSNVINCRNYYYHLRAIDLTTCSNLSGTWSSPYGAKATSSVAPAAPTGVVAQRTGATTATVTINVVNRDTSSPAVPITIDKYNIWRCQISKSADPETATYSLVTTYTPAPTVGTFTWTDAAAPADLPSKELYYRVSALDDCPNESARSAASGVNCQFNGAIAIAPQASPPALQFGIPEQVTVSASGTDTFVSASLAIVRSDGTPEPGFPQTQNVTDTAWNFTWNPSTAGTYTATATVANSGGCVSVVTNTWTVLTAACSDCTVVVPFDPDPTSGNPKWYRQPNQLNNICSFNLTMTNVKLRARSYGSGVANLRLKSMQFVQSGTFTSETVPAPVASYASPGPSVSTTSTAVIDLTGQPGGGLTVPANSASAKVRFIFYVGAGSPASTGLWSSTKNTDKSVLEGDFTFSQTASLCSPSNTGFTKLEITP